MTGLQAEGVTVATFGQGFASMSAPTKELARAILSRALRHGGNLLLRSVIANVAVEKDAAGNVKFTKSKARGRIDASVALAMAVGRAMAAAPTALGGRPLCRRRNFTSRSALYDGNTDDQRPFAAPSASRHLVGRRGIAS